MVIFERYVPSGYVDTERAILKIATIRNPDRWQSSLMHPKEIEIYAGLGFSINAEFLQIEINLIPAVEREKHEFLIDRLADYRDALQELRRALHEGIVRAQYLDDGGQYQIIPSEYWGGDNALMYLLWGTIYAFEGNNWRLSRLTLFKESSVMEFAKSLPPAGLSAADELFGSKVTRERKSIAQAKIPALFEQWRSSRGTDIPSEKEDIEHMKQFGVSREAVRELRKNAPKLPRGKPRISRT